MSAARPSDAFEPELVLLLCGDANDAVTRALADGRARLDRPLVALTIQDLLDGVELGEAWSIAGRRIDPGRTAVVNRLPLGDRLESGQADVAATMARQALWSRLRDELDRFAYASSLPTATSILGCYGSLLDQWEDLPRRIPGVQVPEHSTRSLPRDLKGDVFSVNRWTPYSLGHPLGDPRSTALAATDRLDYVRPDGHLVHLAQIGDAMFFPNPPPTMSSAQRDAMTSVASALSAVSPIRILEHAFFVGRGAPTLYSTFPVPVVSGGHALYPQLVERGLRDDIQRWRRHRPA